MYTLSEYNSTILSFCIFCMVVGFLSTSICLTTIVYFIKFIYIFTTELFLKYTILTYITNTRFKSNTSILTIPFISAYPRALPYNSYLRPQAHSQIKQCDSANVYLSEIYRVLLTNDNHCFQIPKYKIVVA